MSDSRKGSQDRRHWTDAARWLIPLGIVAFCLAVIWMSTTFERVPPILKRGMQPADFPQLVSGLIIVLTALMVFRDEPETPAALGWPVYATLLLMVGFVLLAGVDLFLGLAVFAASLAFAWGERRPHALALVGIVVPFAVFLLFDQVFEVRFPRGLLTRLWYD